MSLRCGSDTVLLPFPALARVLYSHVLIQVQLHCLEIDSIFKCFLDASNPEAHPRKVSQYRWNNPCSEKKINTYNFAAHIHSCSISAAFLRNLKYHYSLTVTLLLLRLCCNFRSRYLKFVLRLFFFPLGKNRIKPFLYLWGFVSLLWCAVCFLLEEFKCLPVSFAKFLFCFA